MITKIFISIRADNTPLIEVHTSTNMTRAETSFPFSLQAENERWELDMINDEFKRYSKE